MDGPALFFVASLIKARQLQYPYRVENAFEDLRQVGWNITNGPLGLPIFFAFSDGRFYLLFVGAGVGLPKEPP